MPRGIRRPPGLQGGYARRLTLKANWQLHSYGNAQFNLNRDEFSVRGSPGMAPRRQGFRSLLAVYPHRQVKLLLEFQEWKTFWRKKGGPYYASRSLWRSFWPV